MLLRAAIAWPRPSMLLESLDVSLLTPVLIVCQYLCVTNVACQGELFAVHQIIRNCLLWLVNEDLVQMPMLMRKQSQRRTTQRAIPAKSSLSHVKLGQESQ